MTFKAECYQSESDIIIIIQNLTLVNLTSIITLYQVWLPFRALGSHQNMHLVFPYFIHFSPHCLCHRVGRVCIYEFGRTFWLWYLFVVYSLVKV